MPLYASGKRRGGGSEKIEVVDVSDRIANAIRENGGRLGDLSLYTSTEMKFVLETLGEMAREQTRRISLMKWMDGVNIDKVVDIHETIGGNYDKMDG